MVTVALIGADGAGKTTIGRRLEKESTLPMKYIYMGVKPESSNHTLPTTRMILKIKRALGKTSHVGGPPDPTRSKPRYKSFLKRVLFGLKSNLRIAHQLGEEWFRQCLAWCLARKLGDKLKKAMQPGRRNDVGPIRERTIHHGNKYKRTHYKRT